MRTIGLIGGMSWESSLEYYRIINEVTKSKLGGLHSAKSIMYSVDFAEIEVLQHQGRWGDAAGLMIAAAQSLEQAGADFVILCTNTMHKLAEEIEANIQVPFLHIADAAAEKIQSKGIKRIGLLGTRFTMEQDFYRGRLVDKYGLEVLIPNGDEREIVHRIIYEELCLGIITPASRKQYIKIMNRLVELGAEGIILGCTEIELLIFPGDIPVSLFPTTRIHAEAAVEKAIEVVMNLRPATLDDLELLRHWDEQPHVIASDPNDDWGWEIELCRKPEWREQLIAEIDGHPIGFLQIIDPACEESHYWGDVPANFRSIDIWIGEETNLGKGYGTKMMQLALARCFANSEVSVVLIDPLANNVRAHRFYERLGFQFVEHRRLGEDQCVVYSLNRNAYIEAAQHTSYGKQMGR